MQYDISLFNEVLNSIHDKYKKEIKIHQHLSK